MKKRKAIKEYKQAVVNAVILAVILGLFLYLGVQLSRSFSVSMSTQRTQLVTDREYLYLEGYIFRDETVIDMDGRQGLVEYTEKDGAKIGVDREYARFYPKSDASQKQLAELQDRLDSLCAQLRRLEGDQGGGIIADLSHVETDLSRTYYDYVDALQRGVLPEAEAEGKLLLEALVDYTVLTGRDGRAEDITALLEQEKATLLNALGSAPVVLTADRSCYFYRETDGYEKLFSASVLESLSPAGLNELALQSPTVYGSDVIGKKIHHPKWYLALPADEATCLRFREGSLYQVTYSEVDNRTLEMTLERIVSDESGAYLLLSSYDLSRSQDLQRAQKVKILMDELSGYRIPAEALTGVENEDGVYVLIGTVVEFRRVSVIGEGNGYWIVATYEQDQAEEKVSETPYLYVNDLIITSGNDLYHGKLLD